MNKSFESQLIVDQPSLLEQESVSHWAQAATAATGDPEFASDVLDQIDYVPSHEIETVHIPRWRDEVSHDLADGKLCFMLGEVGSTKYFAERVMEALSSEERTLLGSSPYRPYQFFSYRLPGLNQQNLENVVVYLFDDITASGLQLSDLISTIKWHLDAQPERSQCRIELKIRLLRDHKPNTKAILKSSEAESIRRRRVSINLHSAGDVKTSYELIEKYGARHLLFKELLASRLGSIGLPTLTIFGHSVPDTTVRVLAGVASDDIFQAQSRSDEEITRQRIAETQAARKLMESLGIPALLHPSKVNKPYKSRRYMVL